ncbi:hypothetical protein AB0M36_13195 [Actinoplanes sp. NPDC051346]|uniref:hypothetical protein n=1 Tax=Actinoplanes sp. NPDC051346 TaxID=3155048 RepID=UPI00342EF49D
MDRELGFRKPTPRLGGELATYRAADGSVRPSGGFVGPGPSGGFVGPGPSGGFVGPGPSGGFVRPGPSGGFVRPGSSGGPVRPSGGFVGLLHGVLTNARMLVHALTLIYPCILLVAAFFRSAQVLAVMATSMVTLFVWALRRARQEDVTRRENVRGENVTRDVNYRDDEGD